MATLEVLGPQEWPQVYRLLKQADFPDVPTDYATASAQLNQALLLGQFRRGRLMAVFAVGAYCGHSAYLDVACRAEWRGRWATKQTLRTLCEILFETLGLHFVWVQPLRPVALHTCLRAGFRYATPSTSATPVLVLTAAAAQRRFGRPPPLPRSRPLTATCCA